MTSHQRALAQELAWDLDAAACKHLTGWWASRERTHAATDDPAVRARILDEITGVCAPCAVLALCAARAQHDRYTGLAAATSYLNGRAGRAAPGATASQGVAR